LTLCRGSISRAEASISAIHDQANRTAFAAVDLGQKLLQIEGSINGSSQIAYNNGQTLQQLLQACQASSSSPSNYLGLLPSSPDFFLARARTLASNGTVSEYHTKIGRIILLRDGRSYLDVTPIHSRPASPFELLSSFLPERYTVDTAIPRFFSYSCYQKNCTEFTKVRHYDVFYSRSPRQWIRLSLSVTIGIESRYWNLERLTEHEVHTDGSYHSDFGFSHGGCIPAALYSIFAGLIEAHPNLDEGNNISIYVQEQPNRNGGMQITGVRERIAKPRIDTSDYLREITKELYHMNCPRYRESDIVQRPMSQWFYNCYFIAFLNSKWVLEWRFSSDSFQVELFLYSLRLYHCLRGTTGISKLVGIVLNEKQNCIKSFLTEIPTRGEIFRILAREKKAGSPVSWTRREKWCRQIVRAVAEIHSKGFVIGSLGHTIDGGVAIDGEDNAIIWRFRCLVRHSSSGNGWAGFFPPELRQISVEKHEIQPLQIRPPMDIFHLSMWIWLVAMNENSLHSRLFCNAAGCPVASQGATCKELHVNPISLPELRAEVPEYVNKIVAACRQKNPNDRPPAWNILEMFPTTDNITTSQKVTSDLNDASPHVATTASSWIQPVKPDSMLAVSSADNNVTDAAVSNPHFIRVEELENANFFSSGVTLAQ
jgi:hypothetical protein